MIEMHFTISINNCEHRITKHNTTATVSYSTQTSLRKDIKIKIIIK